MRKSSSPQATSATNCFIKAAGITGAPSEGWDSPGEAALQNRSLAPSRSQQHLREGLLTAPSSGRSLPAARTDRTVFLGSSPHYSVVRLLQQEADGHERDALLLVHEDRHPAAVTLVHVAVLRLEHAGYAGAAQVHVQDPHLQAARQSRSDRPEHGPGPQPCSGRGEAAPECLQLAAASRQDSAAQEPKQQV